MVVDGSESNGNRLTIHDGSGNNEGVNEEKDVLLPDHQDLELSDIRHDSPRSSSFFSSEASLEDLIKPEVLTVEGDQALMSAPETDTSKAPAKSNDTTSVKLSPNNNVGQKKILQTKEIAQDKMKQSAGNTKSPKTIVNQSNGSHHSTGSEGSSYSFAFPVLVPGLPQRASRKTGAVNPQGRISLSGDEPDLDGENSISRPNPRASTPKKSFCCCCCCCCCFPCRDSIFSSCF